MTVVTVVFPEVSADRVSSDLRWLTEFLTVNKLAPDHGGGMLGGSWGYGVEYENETFMLHPFCWCERDDCPWCLGCEGDDDAYTYYLADGTEADAGKFYEAGGYSTGRVEVDQDGLCDYCAGRRLRAANFLHKPSGSTVHWYKYIGRDNELALSQEWDAVWADVRRSLNVTP